MIVAIADHQLSAEGLRMDKARSINLKLWLTLISTCCAAIFALSLILFSWQVKKDFLIEDTQSDLSHAITHALTRLESTPQTSSLAEIIANTLHAQQFSQIIVTDRRLNVLFSTSPNQTGENALTLSPQLSNTLVGLTAETPIKHQYDTQRQLFTSFGKVAYSDESVNNLVARPFLIMTHYSLENKVSNLYAHYNRNIWIVISAVLVISVLAITISYYFIHKPISVLLALSNRLADFQFNHATSIAGSGELKKLSDNLHKASSTLQQGFEQKKLAQQTALEKQSVLEGIFSALPDIFFIVDKAGKILECHYGSNGTMNIPETPFLGQKLVDVLPAHAAKHFTKAISATEQSGQLTQIEYRIDSDDVTKHFEARLSAIPESQKLVVAVRDITDKKRQEEVILHHAFYDTLTQLPNRFLALDRLQQMIHEAKRNNQLIAVGFIDLDDFKKVNDSMGHEVGDKLLVHSAKILKNALRKHDTVARLGGDEFIVLLGDIADQHHISAIATKLVHLFRSPFEIDDRSFTISLSLGLAVFPSDAMTPNELLRKADSAMYSAKQLGRNTFSFFTESMSQDLNRRLMLEEKMRLALANNQFEVYFQPQYDLRSQYVVGAEALLRWHDEELGWISPGEFIPLAEQTGYIIELGQFVLHTAIQQINSLQHALSTPFRIAVNLSPRQFKDPSLVNTISHLINEFKIDTELLELEITEGVLLSGDELVRDALFELHQLGILISMDDFGTGYSSLNYLRQYPFDVLKIDQSFIFDMNTSEQVQQLVNAIIIMSHNLGIKVIAEGIETQLQLETLASMNCDFGQGYFLGKPMSKIDFEAWLAQYALQPLNIENKSLSIQDY
ncbi:EAL domain-containing protein [Pseudoalteromonas sp. SMS1]|uniref:putative bifunctional diguanylate cyclase/phosphodiesterase n=1 Tax=Pseudoalteromonas sp. SMS1 TaxID=2908894 RepID=UPI001F2E9DD4|nr:EAL domain-containing protein [Pseudoalteromonas sp. SMS1]MCF2859658.1 EAL domain-containing protein [Pseudoalteromonas sp. SMS1]